MFTSQRDRLDAREQEREQIRLQKRMLRDLRWAVERSIIRPDDWAILLELHQCYGKEGPMQMRIEIVPYWRDCQRVNKGSDIPAGLLDQVFPQDMGLFPRASHKAPATRTKATKGTSRKKRSDAGVRK